MKRKWKYIIGKKVALLRRSITAAVKPAGGTNGQLSDKLQMNAHLCQLRTESLWRGADCPMWVSFVPGFITLRCPAIHHEGRLSAIPLLTVAFMILLERSGNVKFISAITVIPVLVWHFNPANAILRYNYIAHHFMMSGYCRSEPINGVLSVHADPAFIRFHKPGHWHAMKKKSQASTVSGINLGRER